VKPFEHPAVLTLPFCRFLGVTVFPSSASELSPAGCGTTVKSDVSKRLFLMKRVSVRLYWIAVASNMMALGILLRGVVVPLEREAQVIAVALTAISMICWLAYFQELNK
jgi:hypothetical protein